MNGPGQKESMFPIFILYSYAWDCFSRSLKPNNFIVLLLLGTKITAHPYDSLHTLIQPQLGTTTIYKNRSLNHRGSGVLIYVLLNLYSERRYYVYVGLLVVMWVGGYLCPPTISMYPTGSLTIM